MVVQRHLFLLITMLVALVLLGYVLRWYGTDDDEAEYNAVGMVIKTLVVRMSE